MSHVIRKINAVLLILLIVMNIFSTPLLVFAQEITGVEGSSAVTLLTTMHEEDNQPVEESDVYTDTDTDGSISLVENEGTDDKSLELAESQEEASVHHNEDNKEQELSPQRTTPILIPGTLSSLTLRKDGVTLNDGDSLAYDEFVEALFNVTFADSENIQSGDTYKLSLPSALSVQGVNEFNVQNLAGDIVGTAILLPDDSEVVVTFNDVFQRETVNKNMVLNLVFGWNHAQSSEGESHYLNFGGKGFNLVKDNQLMFSPVSRDAVTNITVIKESTGEPLNDTVPLGAWGYLKVTIEFAVPNDAGYKAGDTTVVKLPDEMIFAGITPNIVLEHEGTVIGNLTFSEADRTATITYAPGVEEKSDIRGQFYFSMRVNHTNNVHPHPIPQRFNVDFGVTNRIIDLGNLNYTGKPLSPPAKFSKNGYFVDKGRTLHYDIVINQQNEPMENVVLEDVTGIVGNMRDLRIVLGEYYVDADNNRRLRNGEVLNIQPTYSTEPNGDRRFRLELGSIPPGKGISITYKIGLNYQAELGESFENSATLTWNTTDRRTQREVEVYTTAGAVIEGSVFAIEMKKVNEAGQPLEGAKFEVIRDISGKKIGEITTGKDGIAKISNLLRSNYTIREIEAPLGYERTSEEIKIAAAEFTTPTKTVTKTVVNQPALTTFTVTKQWINGNPNNRPEVRFQLKRDGNNYGDPKILPANSPDGTTVVWENLPKYQDASTNLSIYTVEELPVADYTPTISNETATSATVTNTYSNTETVSLSGKKIWSDYNNKFNTRPTEIVVTILRDGQEFNKTVQVTGEMTANEWAFTVEGLPKYNTAGEPYTYTVKEVTVTNYTTTYGANNTITNTYVNNEKINIPVTKQWNDYNNKFNTRPTEIVIKLKQNGVVIQNSVLSTAQNWRFEFRDLPKYDSNGELYHYTIEEDAVQGYKPPVITGDMTNGFTVMNKYCNNEKVTITGKKTWEDANDQDRKRPNQIVVKVMNGNKKVAEKTVTAAEQWAYTFTNLPKYDTLGNLIPYTVIEDPVTEYQSEVEGYNIINRYTPAQTQVSVTKVWKDADNQDGIRPEQISVQLLANGVPHGEAVVLNEANKWMYTWNNLALNHEGQAIAYTLQEINVPAGYTSEIDETATKQFTVTNNHVPETIELTGQKTWEDANNQDGKRPSEITINLLSEGRIVQTLTTNETKEWRYTFSNLPKYNAGQLIHYTIQEIVPEGYSAKYEGNNITNHYTPAKTQVGVTKIWNDADNQDGIRPDFIQVQLYADGKEHGEVVVLNKANEWMYTWNELDLKRQGKDIAYTIQEVGEITGYISVVTEPTPKQFVLTNTHEPEKIEVAGQKKWEDANNQDGKRPKEITVHLLADGKQIRTITANEASQWTYTFTDLPKYKAGKLINYTVDEEVVDDYQKVIDGYVITNRYTPEQTDLTVIKLWEDNDNQDGIRPDKVTVALFADGKEVEQRELTSTTNWQYQWLNLPKYQNGIEIKYEAKEIGQYKGYIGVEEYDISTRTTRITNTHIPEVMSVTTTKTWQDGGNQDGKRPQSVEVHLLANNIKVDTHILTAENNWQYTFTNLPKYREGKVVEYTVVEVNVPKDYQVTYSEDHLHVTNTYTPKSTSFTVMKRWEDKNDVDQLRPQSIRVQLYADGKTKGEIVELNATNDWRYTFEDLPKFSSGVAIQYEVKEVDVPKGYVVTYQVDSSTQVTIINTHIPTPKREEPTLPKTGESFAFNTLIIAILFLSLSIGSIAYEKQYKR